MEAKDLMIGDLVRISHLNMTGEVYRIDRANGDGNGWVAVIDGDYHESVLESIPLTQEILEKNGFVKRSDRDDKLGKMEYYQFEDYGFVYHYSDGEWAFNLVNENPKRRDFSGYLTYVHELQHVLNILNIEKEIKL